MEMLELEIQQREEAGKGYARKIRKQGLVPAVVYGKKKEPMMIQLEARLIEKVLRSAGENTLLSLRFMGNGKENITAMIQDIQREVLRPDIIHVDFKRISLEETTTVMVPIHAVGEPRDASGKGVVEHLLWEVEVECLPLNIPKSIDVDISSLKLGDSIAISDLKLPSGVKVLAEPTDMVIIYNEIKEEVVPAEGEVPLFPTERSKPERVGRKREEEEEE